MIRCVPKANTSRRPARVRPEAVAVPPSAKEPAATDPDATPSPSISAEALVGRYKRLGEALERLAPSQPDQAVPLRRRYFAIPLADALRRPALRAEVADAIAALERLVAALPR